MKETNIEENKICNIEDEENTIASIGHTSWYIDIMYYLRHMKCPKGLSDKQRRTLKLQESKYVFIEGDLFWKNGDGMLLLFLDESHAKHFLREMHEGVCGGHYSAKKTTHKILRVGYY